MKKANLTMRTGFRNQMLRCGAVALALVAMTACKDDAPGIGDDSGVDIPEELTVDGVDLTVGNNPLLATTYRNSHNGFGSRGGETVIPGFPEDCMPAIPTDFSQMYELKATTDFWNNTDTHPTTREYYVPYGTQVVRKDIIGKGSGVMNNDKTPKYYIAGELTIDGTASDNEMEIYILPGGKLIDKSVMQSKTTVYLYKGGDILRASQESEKDINFSGTTVYAEGDLCHNDINIKVSGNIYTKGKIHGKTVQLNGGQIYAGCAVTATDKIYNTGWPSVVLSAGYVSAPEIAINGNAGYTILLRDGGYLNATKKLELTNIRNLEIYAADNDYAMVETDELLVNYNDLTGTFYNVAVKYKKQTGTNNTDLKWNESVKVNEQIDYTVEANGNDACAPVVVGPATPDTPGTTPDTPTTPVIENIGSVAAPTHTHDISATCIDIDGQNAYLSWHTQGEDFHGCIEYLTVNNGTVTLNSYLETAPTNENYGAVDFNHVIFDNGKIFVAGDHPKKGGILGWIDCNNGSFPTDNAAKLNMIQLFTYKSVDSEGNAIRNEKGEILYSNGGSGNCIIRNGDYYQVASVAGFESFNVADFMAGVDGAAPKPKAIAKLASWKFNPALNAAPTPNHERDGSNTGKHIATDGTNVVMLSLIERNNNDNTAKASIKVYAADDVKYATPLAKGVIDDVTLTPVNGKNVIAIEGNDIYVCLGQGGVQRLTISGTTITKAASFKLDSFNKAQLKEWGLTENEAKAACANGLAVGNDGYLYVAHGGAGLVVLDKDDLSYVTRTRHNGGASANYVALHTDGYMYVAYGKSNVQVFGWKKN